MGGDLRGTRPAFVAEKDRDRMGRLECEWQRGQLPEAIGGMG